MMNVRNVVIGLIVSAAVAGIIVSCGGSGGYGSGSGSGMGSAGITPNVVRSASLDGTQAGTGATGTGRGAVVVNPTTMEITGGVTFTGLTGNPTLAHIHRGDTSIVVGLDLAADNATGTVVANATLAPADYAELLAGTLYFNVHTGAFPNGEIRGQLTGTTGLVASVADLTGAQQVPVATTTKTGKGTLVVDANTRQILTGYVTHNVTTADAAHIHCGTGPGTNGPIVVGFTLGTNVAFAPAGTIMTPGDFGSLEINYCYFNVHSTPDGFPNGEIRGDMTAEIIP